jgi:unsaturated pyranuronate lyase
LQGACMLALTLLCEVQSGRTQHIQVRSENECRSALEDTIMADTKCLPATGTLNTALAPELITQVEEAPGHGILPNISLHLAGTTHLFHLDAQPIERINNRLCRQYLHGTNLTFVKWIAKKGAVVPLNHHVNEQVTWITEGCCEVYSNGKKYTMKAGDIMILPPNIPHELVFLEDTIDIEIFAPGRQDWIDGTASYRSHDQ